jgi:hypothetical protein
MAADSTKNNNKVQLSDLLIALRGELAAAQAEGADSDIKFEMESVDIELTTVVTVEAGGKAAAKAKFWVVGAEVEAAPRVTAGTPRLSATVALASAWPWQQAR